MDINELLGPMPPRSGGKSAAGGRKPVVEVDFNIVRSLGEADRELLLRPPPRGGLGDAPVVENLRTSHHTLARVLAEGVENAEASLITGYSPAWISTLGGDPAFQQLVKYYQSQKDKVFVDVCERRRTLGLSALDELQKKMDTEDWDKEELMALAELTLGKAGQGSAPQGQGAPSATALQITFVTATPREEPKGHLLEGKAE